MTRTGPWDGALPLQTKASMARLTPADDGPKDGPKATSLAALAKLENAKEREHQNFVGDLAALLLRQVRDFLRDP
jgi:hypothetical protein